MRKYKDYVVIGFNTTSEAMAMENYCRLNGIKGRLIPTPSAVSAGCGLSWRMEPEDYREELKSLCHSKIVRLKMLN